MVLVSLRALVVGPAVIVSLVVDSSDTVVPVTGVVVGP